MDAHNEGCRCSGVWDGAPGAIMHHAEQWFMPECRKLVYRPGPEIKRLAIVVGHCAYCGGDLSTGVTVPGALDREALYHFLYQWCLVFQPYRQNCDSLGREAPVADERERWYLREEPQSKEGKNTAFLALFTDSEERRAVELWLESQQGKAAKS